MLAFGVPPLGGLLRTEACTPNAFPHLGGATGTRTTPGQALAYKTGELKIRQLRNEAEQALGEAFDLREFHDVVLGSGAIPLAALEHHVKAYIKVKAVHRGS